MRLFIATPVILPEFLNIKAKLSPFVKGNWSKMQNLHITHKFIGEDEPKNWEIELKVPNEKITIEGFGLFDEKILYLKANSPHIDTIAKELNVKNFKPHITLCRIKSLKKEALLKAISQIEIKREIAFELFLYKSTLTNNGPIYEKIFKY